MRRRSLLFVAAVTGLLPAGCGPSVGLDGVGTEGPGDPASSGTAAVVTTDGADDSSSDSPSVDLPPLVCEPDAILCDGSEYGTWRLSSADAQVAAYLYLWPADSPGQGQFVSRWFIDDPDVDHCNRNGRYLASGDLEGTFVFQSDGLGGTVSEQCGGAPDAHSLHMELSRLPDCSGEVLELTVTDSNGDSLYAVEGHAVHCGCQTDYDPYSGNGELLPTDNCLGP